jgi:hypothetical protein
MLTRRSVLRIPMLDLEWSRSSPVAITRHGRYQAMRGRSARAMRILKYSAHLSLALAISSFSAHAQQVAHLRCQGVLFGTQAIIDGTREYATYNALGDGQVRFAGTVAAAGLTGEMHYAGYTATAPFRGVMSGPLGQWRSASSTTPAVE